MKTLLNNLKKSQIKLQKKVEQRDATALQRSKDWYESTKGKKHENSTQTLANANDGLQLAIDSINKFLA